MDLFGTDDEPGGGRLGVLLGPTWSKVTGLPHNWYDPDTDTHAHTRSPINLFLLGRTQTFLTHKKADVIDAFRVPHI